MLLFFVPAVVAVVNYAQLLMVDGWRIFLVIALSTLMVLGATAWVVDKVYRYEVGRLKNERCRAEYPVPWWRRWSSITPTKNCIDVFINSL